MLYDKLTLQYHSATTMSYAAFITLSYLKVFFCIAILYKNKKTCSKTKLASTITMGKTQPL